MSAGGAVAELARSLAAEADLLEELAAAARALQRALVEGAPAPLAAAAARQMELVDRLAAAEAARLQLQRPLAAAAGLPDGAGMSLLASRLPAEARAALAGSVERCAAAVAELQRLQSGNRRLVERLSRQVRLRLQQARPRAVDRRA